MSETSTGSAPGAAHPLPAWKIWANPIWRRYARARLRTKHLVVWLTITLLPASFAFFGIQALVLYRAHLPMDNAGRLQFVMLFAMQAAILFLLGTGQSAGGITAEADEGMLEYQRLTPLTPLAKVFGYLFGLPVREYVMVLATMPYTIWAIWSGGIPAKIWFPLYLVFLSSTILYHLTGLVAGTVVKNRRWAFLVSIAIVILLYTIVPSLSKFGLVFFEYLALLPAALDGIGKLSADTALGAIRTARAISQHSLPQAAEVRFFGLIFSPWAFTLLTQGALILTFIAMLWRRWRREESNLLGKVWAVGLFVWTQVLLLGSSLPLVESGLLFPSREIRRRVFASAGGDWAPKLGEAMGMIAGYGFVTMCILIVLTNIITATEDEQLRGVRRARKLGWARVPAFSDPAGSFWFVVVMAAAGAVGWMFFARGLVESLWFSGTHFPAHGVWTFALVLLTSGLGYQTMLEARGGRWPFFAAVFIGVIPIMIGTILSGASNSFLTASTWLVGMSPLSAPFYAAQTLIPASIPIDVATALPRAFWFWQIVGVLVVACLIVQLSRVRKARALLAIQPPEAPPTLPRTG
jgi:hypothetical protein